MNTEEKLKTLWNSIDYRKGGSLQLDEPSPLEWHVSFVSETQKAVVIISDEIPQGIESSKSITARVAKRLDGRYASSLSLTEKNQEQVFITMCANLIDYSNGAKVEKDALKRVSFRFRQWQRLMAYKKSALMSAETQKGLIGELIYLRKTIESGKDSEEAIEGWSGPDGADQDFIYNEKWHEIKTVGVSSSEVKISSVEQLGDTGVNGELVIERLDKCAPETANCFSLNDAVSHVVELINSNDEVVDKFVTKLNKVGYIRLQEYDKDKYKYSGEERYEVDAEFPRITRGNLRPEIMNCKYLISINSISNWKRN